MSGRNNCSHTAQAGSGLLDTSLVGATARKAAEALRMSINEASPQVTQRPISVSAFIEHYIEHELCAGDEEEAKSFATQRTNKDFLGLYIKPLWGNFKLREVRSVAVEKWLKGLTKENGEPFLQLQFSVARSVYQSVVGRCKTEASMKPVPLHPWVAAELLEWKRTAPYNQPDDWVFESELEKASRTEQCGEDDGVRSGSEEKEERGNTRKL
jgi:hypothetical protein